MKYLISKRKLVQLIIGVAIVAAMLYLNIGLQYILLLGLIAGIIFGKVFCRWMCPLGFIMELMMGGDADSNKQQLYNYHKLGCPVAWLTGLLNRFSLIKIKRDVGNCTNCGLCDQKCYISSLNGDYSLYKKNKKNPATHYSCSKCLECVGSCPTNSLEYKI